MSNVTSKGNWRKVETRYFGKIGLLVVGTAATNALMFVSLKRLNSRGLLSVKQGENMSPSEYKWPAVPVSIDYTRAINLSPAILPSL